MIERDIKMSNKKKKPQTPSKTKAQIRKEEMERAKKNKKIALIVCTAIVLLIAAIITVCALTSKKHKGYYYVEMTVEDYGTVILKLDSKAAPKTVKNFVKLVKRDFYDGLTFHRVMENFMIQGGDPEGNGTGGSSKKIKGEFASNGFYNPIKHERGVISMARSNDPDSASSQFFICNADSASVTNLNGNYAAFGHVIKGMEVVDAITETAKKNGFSEAITDKTKQPVIKEMKLISCKDVE